MPNLSLSIFNKLMSNLRRSTKAVPDMSAPANPLSRNSKMKSGGFTPGISRKQQTFLSSSLGEFLLILCWRGTRFHNQSACGDEDVLIVLIP